MPSAPAPRSLLDSLTPMLLQEVRSPFDDPAWVFEIKFDGYRLLAEFGDGKARLKTRNGADATRWFPELARVLSEVPRGPHVADGEVCVLDEHGRSDFDRLQDRARRRRWYAGCDPVAYCAFDLLVHAGQDIMSMPLIDRKARLAKLLKPVREGVLVVGHFDGESKRVFAGAVLPLALEGLVGKRKTSPYLPGVRSPDWVKIKRKGAVPPERFKRGAPKSIA